MNQGDSIKCNNADILPGNDVGPDLVKDQVYEAKQVIACDSKGCTEQHVDVGLVSKLNYVSCHKCGTTLPGSPHWCAAKRFEVV